MNQSTDPRETLIFRGYDSTHDGVQSIVQGLVSWMFATNQGPRMSRPPSLADHERLWKKDRSTMSRWLKAAEDEGAIIRHADGTLELVIADDSEPYNG